MDQRPDPSFKKYFDWPTHKDPKGTVKAKTVLEEKTAPTSSSSSRCSKPSKKKKRSIVRNLKIHKVTDEDFLLLESFILEHSFKNNDQV